MDVFVSWSGGKDCCLACYRAMNSGMTVRFLASMMTEHTGRLWPHLLSPEVLRFQAHAMGIPLIQWWTKVPDYDDEYRNMLRSLKDEGVAGGVFGDVSIGNGLAKQHRQWIEGVCLPTGITPHLPLWDENREEILRELIESGFEAIIVAVDDDKLGKDYLGRKLDQELLWELKMRHDLSPTGEVGYYHTFVIDGPIFRNRLDILKVNTMRVGPFWYLDIIRCGLGAKVKETVEV